MSRPTLAKGRREGRYVRIAKGVWSADTDSDPEAIVAANLWLIIAAYCPDAVIVDRTAARSGTVDGGVVTIATDTRVTRFVLPGVVVLVRPLVRHPSDTPWANGLHGSSPARALVDNLTESRGHGDRPGRTLTQAELQDWLAQKRLTWDTQRFHRLETRACQIAEEFGQDADDVRSLFAAVSGSKPAPAVRGAFAQAALRGQAWDQRRIDMFTSCIHQLRLLDAPELPPPEVDGELPFYEAYFSNYIEGTEFTIPEARQIVETQTPPARRSADGHDILGTHRCVVDPIGRAAVSDDPEEVIELLLARHRTLMVGRPEIGPGRFKEAANRAGSTEFVRPELVHGTLLNGLARSVDVPAGLHRAIYSMVVISEVHPFTDGNGRVGRLMMNAELSAASQCRIVIPTVLRSEYVSALKRFSNGSGDAEGLVGVLLRAWRWTAAMPWRDRAATDAQLEATNAILEPAEADASGRHLQLP